MTSTAGGPSIIAPLDELIARHRPAEALVLQSSGLATRQCGSTESCRFPRHGKHGSMILIAMIKKRQRGLHSGN